MKGIQERYFERVKEIEKNLGISLLISFNFSNTGKIYKEGTNKNISFQFNPGYVTFNCYERNKEKKYFNFYYHENEKVEGFFVYLKSFLYT
jgi:hypothetical protein